MLKILATIFGFTTAVQAPPARQPSARKKPLAAPPKPPRDVAVVAPYRVKPPLRTPTLGEAVLAFAKDAGELGSRPSPEMMKLARSVIGEDFWAYLRGVKLLDGRVTTFTIIESRIGNLDAEEGLRLRLEKRTYSDLDFWDEVTKREAARREAALFAGRPAPESIAVPDRVLKALAKRLSQRARAARGARGTATGGVKATPESTDAHVTEGSPPDDPKTPDGAPAVALPVPK